MGRYYNVHTKNHITARRAREFPYIASLALTPLELHVRLFEKKVFARSVLLQQN